ncbi:unnamed protein product (macronuclear) [Paramecium tetraurelia]|uniref:Cathepsin propeptide inhibitor domain-containing protein n=1 Tax=Paramecium tetraurelia TaxID=5888 RepID=A0BZ76_PARTE|nr:uncharacterized protein GSPATT00033696001 [Paramecium tetraurelia]CAK63843.1 unnamed protein product [Paramecium tetraurelia]|eukprot:XP_001431241.1 hypothetical protein (macronuclear) [Paramecium tetraurelia strain d4-2]
MKKQSQKKLKEFVAYVKLSQLSRQQKEMELMSKAWSEYTIRQGQINHYYRYQHDVAEFAQNQNKLNIKEASRSGIFIKIQGQKFIYDLVQNFSAGNLGKLSHQVHCLG